MVQKGFVRPGDTCASNPANCVDGISFSMWERTVYDEDVFDERQRQQLRYMLSTGGDTRGSPGVAVYLQGMTLGAVVSTGSQYWVVETVGLLPNNTWNNIGVRWLPPLDGIASDFVGLQLYINQQLVGATVHGEIPPVIAKQPLDPPEFMVGCHKAAGEEQYRHFCPCEFDEFAMWRRALLSNETVFFLGGFEATFANLSPEEFASMVSNIDLTDPDQQKVAVSIASKLADDTRQPEPEQPQGIEEEEDEEEDEEENVEVVPLPATPKNEVARLRIMRDIFMDMILPETIKANQTEEELSSFLGLVNLASNILQEKNNANWDEIEAVNRRKVIEAKKEQEKSNRKLPPPVLEKETCELVSAMEDWVMDSLEQIVYPENATNPAVDVIKKSPTIDMYAAQTSLLRFRHHQTVMFPSDVLRKLDSLEVPTIGFRKPACDEAMISNLFTKYDSYGALSPRRFIKSKFNTKQTRLLVMDSPVLSLRMRAHARVDQAEAAQCLPTIDDLRASPIRVTLSHKAPAPAIREPLFHHDEIVSDVFRRHCVWWNPEGQGGKGAWDAGGCVVLETNVFFTRCACKVLGHYALVAEQVEPKIVDVDSTWLRIIKIVFHVTSVLLLLVYAIVVHRSSQLREMFHEMRMVTALLLLFGNMFMCLSEFAAVRQNRHHCATVAAFQQLCYLAAVVMVAGEGHANFKALTAGVIGGKLRTYCSLAAGISLLSLGYLLTTDIHRYGDDPQCMLGWEADVKLVFFAPVLLCLVLSLVSALLILLNQSTPQLRKESLVADQASICVGYCWFCLYFVVTWTAGMLAYVRFETLEGMPSFYPLFQFMNAACGLAFFVSLGMLSRRFRMVITCRGHERRRLLVAYNVHEDDVEEEPPAQPDGGEESSSSEEDSEEEEEQDVERVGSGSENQAKEGGAGTERKSVTGAERAADGEI